MTQGVCLHQASAVCYALLTFRTNKRTMKCINISVSYQQCFVSMSPAPISKAYTSFSTKNTWNESNSCFT